jgi:hypothetical protein
MKLLTKELREKLLANGRENDGIALNEPKHQPTHSHKGENAHA